MSIGRLLDISRRGLASYQRALDITAHNIANAGNPNYSRQRALIRTGKPQYMNGFEWGTGVTLDRVQRVRDRFVDSELRLGLQNFYRNEKRASVLSRVEQFFGEPSEKGLSANIASFFNSWSELSVSPNSIPLRNKVINSAQQLAGNLQSIYEGIDTVKQDVFHEFTADVNQVNNYLEQIQEYNVQIANLTLTGNTANDLMDSRDALIDKLSELVNITVNFDSSNSANISIGGVLAVDSVHHVQFDAALKDGKLAMTTGPEQMAVQLSGGELAGLKQVYTEDVVNYLEKIDSIFNSIVESVNAQHSTGYNLEDPPVTGINFFEGYSDGVLTINQLILDDPANIAVSADGLSGNGDIASAISDLNNQSILNSMTFSENFSNLVSDLGSDIQNSTEVADSSYLVVQQLEFERATYSGVSIDEEMTNVILFQKSYDASAKLVRVADEMLQTILNMV
jgi:flagellar hook-associated protein 1 FlgK